MNNEQEQTTTHTKQGHNHRATRTMHVLRLRYIVPTMSGWSTGVNKAPKSVPCSNIYIYTRSSAFVPAVAGTLAPGRGEGVVGSRRWLGDIITAELQVVVGVRVKDNDKWWKSWRHTCWGMGKRSGQYWIFANCDGRDSSKYNVREGSACAWPRTVKVSPPYRSTQKTSTRTTFCCYHWIVVWAEHWRSPSLAVISIRGIIAGINWCIYSNRWKRRRFLPRRYGVYSLRRIQKNNITNSPTQGQPNAGILISSPRIPKIYYNY